MNIQSAREPEASRWREFVAGHKGDVTLAFSAFVYIAAWVVMRFSPFRSEAEFVVAVAEAALIGGLCDYIALKMIFERKWYLPNSGVLPRNRLKLIDGIASTIEKEWLTPESIGERLSKMHLVERLGTSLEELDVADFLKQKAFDRLLDRAATYLETEEVIDRLEAFLRKTLPKSFTRIYAILNRVGVRSLSSRIAQDLRNRLPQIRNDPELIAAIESAVHEFGQALHDPQSPAYELASRVIDIMVERAVDASRGQITQMVKDNLMKLDDEAIRIQIESRTRTHLDWIRVNGGIFGAFFGLLFALSRILARHGGEIMERLRLAM
jgi:uncharacterized membrane-anchored protein YjiN (DUF445 family)